MMIQVQEPSIARILVVRIELSVAIRAWRQVKCRRSIFFGIEVR